MRTIVVLLLLVAQWGNPGNAAADKPSFHGSANATLPISCVVPPPVEPLDISYLTEVEPTQIDETGRYQMLCWERGCVVVEATTMTIDGQPATSTSEVRPNSTLEIKKMVDGIEVVKTVALTPDLTVNCVGDHCPTVEIGRLASLPNGTQVVQVDIVY